MPPRTRLGTPVVEGALPREVLRRTLNRHLAQPTRCYEMELDRDPHLAGRVVLVMDISRDGSVSSARVTESIEGGPHLAACIEDAARLWSFPSADAPTRLEQPLVLEPAAP